MPDFVSQNTPETSFNAGNNPYQTGTIGMQNAPAGSFGEIAEASFNNSITPAILGYSGLLGSRIGNQLRDQPLPKLSPQDIEGKYGIKVDAPMEDFEAKYIADAQRNQKQYQMATENASGVKTFAADSMAFLADPINLGSMFIPIAGQARVGAAFGLDAATIAGRAATRAITFGTAGAVSQAPLSAIKFGLSQTQHTDYSIADAMRDTLFAGVTGAIAGPLFGGLKDAIMGSPKWADTEQRFQRMKYADKQAVSQVGIAQMAKENPVDIEPLINSSEGEQKAAQQFIESQHENGVMGLGKQELEKTVEATHVEPEVQDPHTEADKMQAQADQLEASMRDKVDMKAMAEHDAWKNQQGTLDKAYQALQECLTR